VIRSKLIPYYFNFSVGNYKVIDGGMYSNKAAAALANRVNIHSDFQAGMYLPALTFSGGSKYTWGNADSTISAAKSSRRAKVDSTRSVFLDTMKQLNAMKRMGDYIVATYGTTGQGPFIWAWLDEVKWDRKNGRSFSNEHVNR
jgi:hypothetical protein